MGKVSIKTEVIENINIVILNELLTIRLLFNSIVFIIVARKLPLANESKFLRILFQ